jgi:hypothetical protein
VFNSYSHPPVEAGDKHRRHRTHRRTITELEPGKCRNRGQKQACTRCGAAEARQDISLTTRWRAIPGVSGLWGFQRWSDGSTGEAVGRCGSLPSGLSGSGESLRRLAQSDQVRPRVTGMIATVAVVIGWRAGETGVGFVYASVHAMHFKRPCGRQPEQGQNDSDGNEASQKQRRSPHERPTLPG